MTHMLADPEIWVLVSFVAFFVLFGGKLWTALTGLLDGRANAIRAELAEAQLLRSEAEKMLADAQRARTEALAEAAALLLRSHEEAAQVAQAAMAEAEASAKRRERMAIERIAAAEKAALAEVRQAAAEVATRSAALVIAGGLPEETQLALVDAAIADLPRALRAA